MTFLWFITDVDGVAGFDEAAGRFVAEARVGPGDESDGLGVISF
ncbi:MAG: hypothetical protein QOE71_3760 [Pseudonocardiales bacterium]|jgi:hypothetical protein|nr:hypothetical protein [Pseudonocardiales bacterium]MDQ1752704.1 hypothetical protein [Pseudonocardiales bacterium]